MDFGDVIYESFSGLPATSEFELLRFPDPGVQRPTFDLRRLLGFKQRPLSRFCRGND